MAVATRAHADTVSVEFAGIPYLNHVRLDLSADAAADMAKKAVTLKQSGLRLNDLTVGVSGSAASVGDDLDLDLDLRRAQDRVHEHPVAGAGGVRPRLREGEDAGLAALSGNVKGEYGKTAFPSFMRTKVDNAAFRYPDLPLPARDIFLDLGITNPGGSADSTTVNLSRFHLVLGKNPVDAVLVLRTPISDPDVDARMQGKVDLADVRRTIKLDNVHQLAGTIAADAAVRTRMSYVDKKQYDRVAASGTVDVRDLTVKSKALPHPLAITAGVARAGAGAGAAQVVQRHHREQRSSRVGHDRQPARLRLPGRRPQGQRDAREQQVRSWTSGGAARASCR